MWAIASAVGVDHADRELEREVLGVPVLLGRLVHRRLPGPPRARGRRRAASTPASRERPQRPRQERLGDVGVHEQRLGRVAHPGPLKLGVEDDRPGGLEVGARVDVHVAVARGGVDHGHRGHALQRRLQPLAAARDDQVDDARSGWPARRAPRARRPPRATSAPSGSPASAAACGGDRRQHGVGVRGRARAAQHDRVARLQAQRGGVDRHVRARLVDDRHDAERHPHLAHVEPVGQPRAVDHLADRVGQRRDLAHARGHRRRPGARRARAGRAARSERPLSRPASRSRALASRISSARSTQRDRDRLERGVLDAGAERRQRARRPLGGRAGLGD